MSPAGESNENSDSQPHVWLLSGSPNQCYMSSYQATNSRSFNFNPVINLKADTPLTGTGASDNHWKVQ